MYIHNNLFFKNENELISFINNESNKNQLAENQMDIHV